MAEVIKVDFGKEAVESARKLSRLLGIVEAQERDLLVNPAKYFDMAQREILRLQMGIREAQDAMRQTVSIERSSEPPQYHAIETVSMEKGEYYRLRRAVDIIRSLVPDRSPTVTR